MHQSHCFLATCTHTHTAYYNNNMSAEQMQKRWVAPTYCIKGNRLYMHYMCFRNCMYASVHLHGWMDGWRHVQCQCTRCIRALVVLDVCIPVIAMYCVPVFYWASSCLTYNYPSRCCLVYVQYVCVCIPPSALAGWLTINAWPMLPTCIYLYVLHILYVTRAAYSLYDIPEMCSLEIQYLCTYIRTTYVPTYKYTLKKRYCCNMCVCMCYLCVTIISGYKIWRFSKFMIWRVLVLAIL